MVSTRQMSIINGSSVAECSTSWGTTSAGPDEVATRSRNNSMHTEGGGSSGSRKSSTSEKPAKQLLELPVEVLEKILGFFTFESLSQFRRVSTKFDAVCGQMLNTSFQKLQTQMLQRFQVIKSKMPRRESARRNHHLACESDIIETIHMRLTLLQMSFGKHIERKHCCFFPGEILDEVYNVLRHIRTTQKLQRPYKVTDELFDLSTMAMEYFKEKIEPSLPEIAYFNADFLDFTGTFSSSGTQKYLAIDSSPLGPEETKEIDRPSSDNEEPQPQSNMVLRKGIRKIKQGMKRYNSQLSLLRQDLRSCKKKTSDQQKQISEQQKQMAEQQKQTVEYATRLDEYDKKNEEISRKFSTLLQELNKCKTELQYWRSKSPATSPFCTGCGSQMLAPTEDIEALMNQGVIPEDIEQAAEFIPIASTSKLVEIVDLKEEPVAIVPIVNNLSSSSSSGPKHKLEDSTPTSSNGIKSRRITKSRNKRVRI